jgi:hypothetical protein
MPVYAELRNLYGPKSLQNEHWIIPPGKAAKVLLPEDQTAVVQSLNVSAESSQSEEHISGQISLFDDNENRVNGLSADGQLIPEQGLPLPPFKPIILKPEPGSEVEIIYPDPKKGDQLIESIGPVEPDQFFWLLGI